MIPVRDDILRDLDQRNRDYLLTERIRELVREYLAAPTGASVIPAAPAPGGKRTPCEPDPVLLWPPRSTWARDAVASPTRLVGPPSGPGGVPTSRADAVTSFPEVVLPRLLRRPASGPGPRSAATTSADGSGTANGLGPGAGARLPAAFHEEPE